MNDLYTDPHHRRRTVLVAVVNNPTDLRRAAEEGWYRLPQSRAPRRIAADFIALYQTSAFAPSPEAGTITYIAPIEGYHMLTRAELLPDEADHPRAEDYYFRIDIGPLMRLDRPVPARSYRRLTFIHTSLESLLRAEDTSQLSRNDGAFDTLWSALRENRLKPLSNRIVDGWPVDVTLRVQEGYLGIRFDDERAPLRDGRAPSRWTFLHISPVDVETDLSRCLHRIGAALVELGGSLDARPSTNFIE